jgi:hypothetical protein
MRLDESEGIRCDGLYVDCAKKHSILYDTKKIRHDLRCSG